MRVLVTGAAGFIGSHLCEFLLATGAEVIGMDNFITAGRDNLDGLQGHPRFTLVRHNVTEYISVDGPLDWVLHLASPASPRDYLELPIQTLKVGSLGTYRALGLAKAKGARFLLASTSEVYGDPLVHPQPEDYWGHVNPIGPRGVYDEAKRFAEAMTMAYHRAHGVDTRIARVFNSIPADESTILFDNDTLRVGPVQDIVNELQASPEGIAGRKLFVPAFDPDTGRMELRQVSAVIKHRGQTEVYEVATRYGRRVRVTADHSVFRRGPSGKPEAVAVRQLRVGDHIAIPSFLPMIESDRPEVDVAEHLCRLLPESRLWDYAVCSPSLRPIIAERRLEIEALLATSGRYPARRLRDGSGRAARAFIRGSLLPLAVAFRLAVPIPPDARIRTFKAGARIAIPNRIAVDDDVLWLLGFFMAGGCAYRKGRNALLSFRSDQRLLDRAATILERVFEVPVVRVPATPPRGPTIAASSAVLHWIFERVFEVLGPAIPSWILQLPLPRLKWFLEGYREGGGTHGGATLGRQLRFETASEPRARDLALVLLRFGILASLGRCETTFRRRPGDRRSPFFRLTVGEVSDFDVLGWDRGVKQTLNARRMGDLVWAKVQSVERSIETPYVYDFSVPGAENFIAGTGVCCHNTYGPRMRLDDGRAIPAFLSQALTGQPLTVFGDGSQTRSFQYISDLIAGLWRLMQAPVNEPVNLGNPQEMTLLELAKRILRLSGSSSEIVFRPLPVDDPKVRQPDITRARRLLGWEPRVDLDEGLRLTIEWFRPRVGR